MSNAPKRRGLVAFDDEQTQQEGLSEIPGTFVSRSGAELLMDSVYRRAAQLGFSKEDLQLLAEKIPADLAQWLEGLPSLKDLLQSEK